MRGPERKTQNRGKSFKIFYHKCSLLKIQSVHKCKIWNVSPLPTAPKIAPVIHWEYVLTYFFKKLLGKHCFLPAQAWTPWRLPDAYHLHMKPVGYFLPGNKVAAWSLKTNVMASASSGRSTVWVLLGGRSWLCLCLHWFELLRGQPPIQEVSCREFCC